MNPGCRYDRNSAAGTHACTYGPSRRCVIDGPVQAVAAASARARPKKGGGSATSAVAKTVALTIVLQAASFNVLLIWADRLFMRARPSSLARGVDVRPMES